VTLGKVLVTPRACLEVALGYAGETLPIERLSLADTEIAEGRLYWLDGPTGSSLIRLAAVLFVFLPATRLLCAQALMRT
jgi:hypothetical protein